MKESTCNNCGFLKSENYFSVKITGNEDNEGIETICIECEESK